MTRWLATLVATLVLVSAGVLAVSSALSPSQGGVAAIAADEEGEDEDARGEEARGQGPPPWAQSHGHGKPEKAGSAWKQLSPAERSRTMKRLTREHAEGMAAFAACVAQGKASCERPLPPGLAKRL